MPPEISNRELVLAENEQATIQDSTKGHTLVYVGPHKASLSETDRPVRADAKGQFTNCNLQESKSLFVEANEGSYIVLENPSNDENSMIPEKGSNNAIPLKFGRKINIPGPARFPLWPGQRAVVVGGHQLKTNQYLIARVYNDVAAAANWDKTVMKTKELSGDTGSKTETAETPQNVLVLEKPANLTIGKLFVVPGTHVSFYIPPTGIEIVPDENGKFVRDAVTLERLEYCVLLDESGEKRFVPGPRMVFPEPTEEFVDDGENNKVFRALELNHLTGIYVKVIADYKEGEKEYKVGDELFIRGPESGKTLIYYPRPEHAIIQYGDQKKHHAVTVPAGEARYVLDRDTGVITTVRGPKMLLCDPRREVIVRRILDERTIKLLFPGNAEAIAYNKGLEAMAKEVSGRTHSGENFVTQSAYSTRVSNSLSLCASLGDVTYGSAIGGSNPRAAKGVSNQVAGDAIDRKTSYTPPRTLTLDTKYDGAVAVKVWNGFAVMVVNNKGERHVEVGPKTVLLEYDETLEPITLSTGKPKTTDNLKNTVYLRVKNNKVSDIVDAGTSDLCDVQLKLSYRVNFEGDEANKWFDVENYVKFLCDHVRSKLKNEVRKHGIREFHANAIDIIRDCILGKSEDGKRPGLMFVENSMRIYDVEVLGIKIGDDTISSMLIGEQHATVKQTLEIEKLKRQLELTSQQEGIQRQIAELRSEAKVRQLELRSMELEEQLKVDMADVEAKAAIERARKAKEQELQVILDKIAEAELARDKKREDQQNEIAKALQTMEIERLEAETSAVKDKAAAITPQMVQALQSFGDKDLLARATESLAPLAILEKKPIMDVLGMFFQNSSVQTAMAGSMLASKLKD